MGSRKGKPKPKPTAGTRKTAALLREIARRRPVHEPDPVAADRARDVLAQALPYLNTAPLFFDTAMATGVVPEPPAVFTQPTSVLPTVTRRGSLLGLCTCPEVDVTMPAGWRCPMHGAADNQE